MRSQLYPVAARRNNGPSVAVLCLRSVAGAALLLATPYVLCAAQSRSSRAVVKPVRTAPRASTKMTPPALHAPVPPAESIVSVVSVVVRPNCEVSGPSFTLGDIAEIRGQDKALVGQLTVVEIGASPLPGLSRIINPGDVTVRLRQHRLESARVDVVLPPGIRITRAGRDIAADEITAAAIESAKDAIKNVPGATLEPVSSGSRITVSSGKTQIVAGAWRGTLESGNLTVPVSVLVDGKAAQLIDVALKVHRKTTALVAVRQIQIHEIIAATDVSAMLVDLPAGMATPLTDLGDAVGKRATRRILVDAPIGADMVEKAPLIVPNDNITIEFIYGALRITASGIARQAGAAGDTVHVLAVDTHKELDGVVIDRHTVRVAENNDQ